MILYLQRGQEKMKRFVLVAALGFVMTATSGCFTLNWNHNRRHLRKFIDQVREVHRDIDRIVFDLDADPSD